MAKPVPDGFHTVTPHITVRGAAKAIDFYRKAFGAEEISRVPGPGGALMHAMIRVGDCFIMLNDEFPDWKCFGPQHLGGSPVTLSLYVDDVDGWHRRAVEAGATETMPPQDMFWGDRYSKLTDPFGHQWSIATHKEDLTPEQIRQRQQEHFAGAQ